MVSKQDKKIIKIKLVALKPDRSHLAIIQLDKTMKTMLKFFALAAALLIIPSIVQANDLTPREERLIETGRLDRTKYAVVVASGRMYVKHFLLGITERPLTGRFYRNSKKNSAKTDPVKIIKDGFLGSNIYRVTLVPAGTWVMRDWYSLQANSYGYNTIDSPPKKRPWAKFTVKAGDVVYIGDYIIRAYEDEKKKVTPFAIKKNMKAAREALASEYPKLVRKLVYRRMRLIP